jgi:hypothetical protein
LTAQDTFELIGLPPAHRPLEVSGRPPARECVICQLEPLAGRVYCSRCEPPLRLLLPALYFELRRRDPSDVDRTLGHVQHRRSTNAQEVPS